MCACVSVGMSSPFLLLSLCEPLDGIHMALLGSLMDIMSLQNNQPELMQPLSLDEGLALVSSSCGGDCKLLSVLRVEPWDQTHAASSQVETGPQPAAPPVSGPHMPPLSLVFHTMAVLLFSDNSFNVCSVLFSS